VSQAKHYCKICRCWCSGNKRNIQVHETSERHIENTARQLRAAVAKESAEKKEEMLVEREIMRINQAAVFAHAFDPFEGTGREAAAAAAAAAAREGLAGAIPKEAPTHHVARLIGANRTPHGAPLQAIAPKGHRNAASGRDIGVVEPGGDVPKAPEGGQLILHKNGGEDPNAFLTGIKTIGNLGPGRTKGAGKGGSGYVRREGLGDAASSDDEDNAEGGNAQHGPALPPPGAIAAVVASKPCAWRKVKDEATGHFYYFNGTTEESTWHCPPDYQEPVQASVLEGTHLAKKRKLPDKLPGDWILCHDPNTGLPYYFNQTTSVTQWTKPEDCPFDASCPPAAPEHPDDIAAAAVVAAKQQEASAAMGFGAWEEVNTDSSAWRGNGEPVEPEAHEDDPVRALKFANLKSKFVMSEDLEAREKPVYLRESDDVGAPQFERRKVIQVPTKRKGGPAADEEEED